MKNILIFLAILTHCSSIYANNLNNKIIKDLTSFETLKEPMLIISLPQKDCYKCSAPLSQIIDKLAPMKIDYLNHLLIVSDNYVYAKKLAADYKINCKIERNLSFVQYFSPDNRASIILVNQDTIAQIKVSDLNPQSIQYIVSFLDTTKKNTVNIQFKDSLCSSNFLACKYKTGYLLFDPLLQDGIFVNHNTHKYIKSADLNDSAKYFQLKGRYNKDKYVPLSYSTAKAISKNIHLPLIHFKNITSANNILYCIFSIQHFYKERLVDTQKAGFSAYYLGINNSIKSSNDSNIFSILSYNHFYFLDSFSYKRIVYSPISHLESEIKITNNDVWLRVDEIDLIKQRKVKYAGVARLRLQNNGDFKMVDLDTSIAQDQWFDKISNDGKILTIKKSPNCENEKTYIQKDGNDIYYSSCDNNPISAVIIEQKGTKEIKILNSNNDIETFNLSFDKAKIESTKNRKISFTPIQTLTTKDGNFIIFTKQMIDEDFNYGLIKINSISE